MSTQTQSVATVLGVDAGPSSRQIQRRSVASWVLYDLANTCFSLGVVTLYFPELLEHVFGYPKGEVDGAVGMLASVAAVIVFILAPVLGAISDQAARRLPFLAVSTVLCITATFFIAQATAGVSFLLFVAAVICFQAGLIFYDSLLPEVSTDENRGRIGGIGVGVGYIGSLLAYAIGTCCCPARGRRPSTTTPPCSAASPSVSWCSRSRPSSSSASDHGWRRHSPGGWRRWRSRSWRRRRARHVATGACSRSWSGACSTPMPPTR